MAGGGPTFVGTVVGHGFTSAAVSVGMVAEYAAKRRAHVADERALITGIALSPVDS